MSFCPTYRSMCNGNLADHGNCYLMPDVQVREAYFDTGLDAWVLSKYADVIAALRSDSLQPVGARTTVETLTADEEGRLKMRAETMAALSSTNLETWRQDLEQVAQTLLSGLELKQQSDLVADFAKPLCEQLALVITHPVAAHMPTLLQMAEQVSAAAAEPFDLTLAARSDECESALRKHFLSGPASLKESGFVAISQTVPRLLSRCWLALVQQPKEWVRLHEDPSLMRTAADELFRYAGLTQTLFRRAQIDLHLESIHIRQGERLSIEN